MFKHRDDLAKKMVDTLGKLTPENIESALQWVMDLGIKKTAPDAANIESGATSRNG